MRKIYVNDILYIKNRKIGLKTAVYVYMHAKLCICFMKPVYFEVINYYETLLLRYCAISG